MFNLETDLARFAMLSLKLFAAVVYKSGTASSFQLQTVRFLLDRKQGDPFTGHFPSA